MAALKFLSFIKGSIDPSISKNKRSLTVFRRSGLIECPANPVAVPSIVASRSAGRDCLSGEPSQSSQGHLKFVPLIVRVQISCPLSLFTLTPAPDSSIISGHHQRACTIHLLPPCCLFCYPPIVLTFPLFHPNHQGI